MFNHAPRKDTATVADRTEVIEALRDLASELERSPKMPTPTTVMLTTSLPSGHGFCDVIDLAETLAPCDVEMSTIPGKASLVRRFGPLHYTVMVDAAAAGETRTVTRAIPSFFVDTEVARAAAQGRR